MSASPWLARVAALLARPVAWGPLPMKRAPRLLKKIRPAKEAGPHRVTLQRFPTRRDGNVTMRLVAIRCSSSGISFGPAVQIGEARP